MVNPMKYMTISYYFIGIEYSCVYIYNILYIYISIYIYIFITILYIYIYIAHRIPIVSPVLFWMAGTASTFTGTAGTGAGACAAEFPGSTGSWCQPNMVIFWHFDRSVPGFQGQPNYGNWKARFFFSVTMVFFTI